MTIQTEGTGYEPEVKPEDTFLSKLSDRLDAGDEVIVDETDGEDGEDDVDLDTDDEGEDDGPDVDLDADDPEDEDEEHDEPLGDEEAADGDDEPEEEVPAEPKLSRKAENRFQKLANENRDLKATIEQLSVAQTQASQIQQQQLALQQAAYEQARQQQLRHQQAQEQEVYEQQLLDKGFIKDSWEHQSLLKQAQDFQVMQAKMQAMEQQAQQQEAQRFQQEYQSNLGTQLDQALTGRDVAPEQKQYLLERAYEHAYLHQMQTGQLLSVEDAMSKTVGAVVTLFPKKSTAPRRPKKKVSERALKGAAARGGSTGRTGKNKSSKSRAKNTEPESPEMGAVRRFIKRNGRSKG